MFTSLAFVAEKNDFVRPKMNSKGIIDIKNGRHPVVEKMMQNDMFIANDTYLDNGNHRLSIITGPNMAGKSTYMRQTALIVLHGSAGKLCPCRILQISVSATGSLPVWVLPMTWQAARVPLWWK
ncbi:MAG: MutS-related protein [Blautia sp.]